MSETAATPDWAFAELDRLMARGAAFFGSRYAIMGGAMSWVSERHLVAALSNAGAFGVIACGAMEPPRLAEEIAGTQALTQKPFGVNLITMHPRLDQLVDACLEAKVGHIVFAGGIPPGAAIRRAKEGGAKVVCFAPALSLAKRLVRAGADGLVLFNRFLQPEIDLEELAVQPRLVLSTPFELLLPLRWVAVLHGRIDASLAITSGIHGPDGMLQALLAGADAGMIASVLYKKGFGQIGEILRGMTGWMAEREYESVAQLKGSMSLENCPDASAFARGNYMKTLISFTGQPI